MSVWDSSSEAESLALIVSLLFAVLGFSLLIYVRRRKESGNHPGMALAGSEMRILFLTCLGIANACRSVSILIDVGVREQVKASALDASWKTWTRDVLMCLPSLMFASSFSVVVMFWAQVYYAAVLRPFPLLRALFVFANVAAYGAFLLLICITLHMSAWEQFAGYLDLLLGGLFILDSIGLFIFGVRVAGNLAERRTSGGSRKYLIRRVLLLTALVPVLLFARGFWCIFIGAGWINGNPFGVERLSWDSVVFGFSELIPSILFVLMFKGGSSIPENHKNEDFAGSSVLSDSGGSMSLASPLLGQVNLPENEPQWEDTEKSIDQVLQKS